MGKKISTYYRNDETGYCEIHVDLKEEYFYVKYYKKDAATWFHVEDFNGKSLRYVEDAAENWSLGYKEITPQYERTLL